MSLNGLDNPTIIEAYQTALAEAGGWFLLKYVSRDEIALLERGTGGVPEVRSTLVCYDELSPVFGFLQYRRRKVLLKYMPQGLSRLVQARTTVQFQSVLEKFSPHDTVFAIFEPADLTESALSSACLLHAASGSITSSSSSLRRRKLMEITEDAEEAVTGQEDIKQKSPDSDTRRRSCSHLSESTAVPTPMPPDLNEPHVPNGQAPTPETTLPSLLSDRQPPMTVATNSGGSSPPRFSLDELTRTNFPRKSSQSARPSQRDLELATAYSGKVKRGPRPSLDINGRPRTAGALSKSQDHRPVAFLPAGVRSSSTRKSNSSTFRPQTQPTQTTFIPFTSKRAFAPVLVPPPPMPLVRPPLSPSAKSTSGISIIGASPEKERLMKALQLRKRQMEKRAEDANRKKLRAEEQVHTEQHTEEGEGELNSNEANAARAQKLENSDHQIKESPDNETSTNSISIDRSPEAQSEPRKVPAQDQQAEMRANNLESDQPSITSDSSVSSTEQEEFPGAGSLETPCTIYEEEPERCPVQRSPVEVDCARPTFGEDKLRSEIHQDIRDDKAQTFVANKVAARDCPEAIPLPESSKSLSKSDFAPRPSSFADAGEASEHDETSVPSTAGKDVSGGKEKRSSRLQPIEIPVPDDSDCDKLLEDDSFMEELKSATVEEARHVSVAKSPLFSSPAESWRNMRSVSNPGATGTPTTRLQKVSFGRSASNSYTDGNVAAPPVLVAKKINVSSGISKRIKALERFSNSRDTPSVPSHSVSLNSASSSFAKRASVSPGDARLSVRPHPKNLASNKGRTSRTSSVKRQAPVDIPAIHVASAQARIVHDTSDSRGDIPTGSSAPNILDPAASQAVVEQSSSSNTLDPAARQAVVEQSSSSNILHPKTSQDIVEQSLSPANASPRETLDTGPTISAERTLSVSSVGSNRNMPTSLTRSDSRLSTSSQAKIEQIPSARSTSDSTTSGEDRRESRTSRLLRRMSSITSNSKKTVMNALSPVLKEEDSVGAADKFSNPASEVPKMVDIGEVNVQFPDNLLWKRRFMQIDNGFLVLAPASVDSSSRNMIKRYHLSEFKKPCLPDEDMQELPNSILLDFHDGRTLQCACESRQGQASVLRILLDAHGTHQ